MIALTFRKYINWQAGFFLAFYLVLGYICLKSYLNFSVTPLLGVAGLVLAPVKGAGVKGNRRFFYWALLFAGLALFVPVKTLAYAAIVFAVMFLVESYVCKLNMVPLFLALFMSPVFEYAVTVFSFPVRIQLTGMAGSVLSALGSTQVEGNMVIFNGAEFSVDPACMGLHMLAVSLVMGIVLMGIFAGRLQRTVPVWIFFVQIACILVLSLIANLFRIITLVYFHLLPDQWGHEAMGLLCFVVYTLLPACVLTWWMMRKWGKVPVAVTEEYTPVAHPILPNILLLLLIGILAMRPAPVRTIASVTPPEDYAMEQLKEVTKLTSPQALIYIKPVMGFFATDHHPTICWQGSGYQFRKVQEENWNGFNVYTAELEKGNERLYTAWWYSSGKYASISQWEWRWDALLYGRDYSLLNVTVAAKADLRAEVARFRLRTTITPAPSTTILPRQTTPPGTIR